MKDLDLRAKRCQEIHRGPGAFIAAGCWDVGTAVLLQHCGVQMIETTSSGVMFSKGLPDARGLATRDAILENAAAVLSAVDVPVAADLENGFGHSPQAVAETIRLAADIGLAGGSIEDATGQPGTPLYDIELATARVRAAAEAARSARRPFMLTARIDHCLYRPASIEEVIARALAYERAGADVILAPGLADLKSLKSLCEAVRTPVAVAVGTAELVADRQQLEAAGVRKIGMLGSLLRVALSAYVDAIDAALKNGTFQAIEHARSGKWFNDLYGRRRV